MVTSPDAFAELHCKSNFSFLYGASHPEELVAQAAELGYRGIAITDECSLVGRRQGAYGSEETRHSRSSSAPNSC